MQVSGLGIPPVIAAAVLPTAAKVGGSLFDKLFGGGDTNYANNFSKQVGVGKKFLQTAADAYYARGNRIGVSAFDIARLEYKAGGALSDNEILVMTGKAPPTSIGQPPAFSEAYPSAFPASYGYSPRKSPFTLPLIIGGVAVLGVGTMLLLRRK